jgi:hypothetical protein
MTKRSLRRLFKLAVLTSATLLALSAHASLQERKTDQQKNNRHDDDDDRDRDDDRRLGGLIALATRSTPSTVARIPSPWFRSPADKRTPSAV